MRKLLLLLFVTTPVTGFALVPALPEDVLCWSSYVVVGRVEAATGWVCSPVGDWNCPNRTGQLTVRVREILGSRNPDSNYSAWQKVLVGDTTAVTVEVRSNDIWEGGHTVRDPSATGMLSVGDVEKVVLGKDFVFGISMARWDPQSAPYQSTIWRLERKPWVEKILSRMSTLPNADCPRPPPISAPGG